LVLSFSYESHEHFGIAADDRREVDAVMGRLRANAYAIDMEDDRTCCYGELYKVWANDPDGRRWETYVVLRDTNASAACC